MPLSQPWVFQALSGSGSLTGLLLEAHLDEVLGSFTRVSQSLPLWLLVIDLVVDFILALAHEGSGARQQNVCDDTKGPHVNFVVVLLLVAQLGSHVKRRT